MEEKQNRMETEGPTQEIPDWLLDFTTNLEDLEKHVPEHFSEGENPDSEGSIKVADIKITKTQYFIII